MNRITIAGNLIVDYLKEIDSYPDKGRLSSILNISRGVGGCACNTSIDLARMDKTLSVSVLGRVGSDENGRYIREILRREGIRDDICVDDTLPTSFTDVMSEIHGERTFFQARGANAVFGYDDIPFDTLDCELFHIGYILLLDQMDAEDAAYGTVLAKALLRLQSRGIKTSIDVVSEHSDRFVRIVTPSLKYCDYLIVNEFEAAQVTGSVVRDENGNLREDNIRQALECLLALGVHELAAIHAPEGGWAMAADGSYATVESFKLPQGDIKGHVGAGDAFCAGMLYGICCGFGLQKCLETAAGAAACSLTEANSVDGMRSYEGILEAVKKWN
jgi:sugar/nucleoside kinase (ribokinase family)